MSANPISDALDDLGLDDLGLDDRPLRDQYIDLVVRKRTLETEINQLKRQIAPLEEALIDELVEHGDRRTAVNQDGWSAHLIRKIWARPTQDKPAACHALREAGLGDFVEEGFNTNSLSAHFREIAKQYIAEHGHGASLDDLLPEPLRGAIALTEDTKLGLTRS